MSFRSHAIAGRERCVARSTPTHTLTIAIKLRRGRSEAHDQLTTKSGAPSVSLAGDRLLNELAEQFKVELVLAIVGIADPPDLHRAIHDGPDRLRVGATGIRAPMAVDDIPIRIEPGDFYWIVVS